MVTRVVLVFSIVAWSSIAAAQVKASEVKCGVYETQAECHARLKCKDGEEVEDCQRRLLQCKPGEPLGDCMKRASSAGANNNANNNTNNDANRTNDDANRNNDNNDNNDRERNDRERDDRDNGRDDQRRTEREPDRRDRGDRDRDRGRGRSSGRRERRSGGGSHAFVANKKFGIGLELGEPTGVNGKYFLSKSHALDFGLGWIYHSYYYGDGVHAYADFLWHPVSLASTPSFELPFYVGIGGRFWQFDYCDRNNVCNYTTSALGIRVPLGISFDFNNAPIDIFLQVVPVLDFLGDAYYNRYGDHEHFGFDGSVGIRFWFK